LTFRLLCSRIDFRPIHLAGAVFERFHIRAGRDSPWAGHRIENRLPSETVERGDFVVVLGIVECGECLPEYLVGRRALRRARLPSDTSSSCCASSGWRSPTTLIPSVLEEWQSPLSVESRCGAVALGWAYRLPPLSSGGASMIRP
jgi:hypothetical protein